MTEITYQTTEPDATTRHFRVSVPTEYLQAVEQTTLKQYAKRVSLPGFRKGQASQAMIRKRFGNEIRNQAMEEAFREAWQKITQESAIQPISSPKISGVTTNPEQPLEFDITVEVLPDLKLEKVSGFSLERKVREVTDERVEDLLLRLREERAVWQPVEDRNPEVGDLVNVTVTALDEGIEAGPPYEFVIGEGRAIPDLEQKILGLQRGETVETEIHYPDDHPEESRRGTSRAVRITLHETKVKALPELDDHFALEIGGGRFEDLTGLRQDLRQNMEQTATEESWTNLRAELIRLIAEANQVPAPREMTHRMMHAYAESYRIGPDQLEAFEAAFQEEAEGQVKRHLIIEALAAAQNLQATEAQIDEHVAAQAASVGAEPGQIYSALQKGNQLAELERSLTEERVFAWLLEQSTVTEVLV